LGTVTITVGPRACAGSSVSYGYGCAAGDGSVPTLTASGCPVGGQQVDINLDGGPSTGFAVMALGYDRGIYELNVDGCTLRVGTLLATTPLLALTAGSTTHSIAIPTWLGDFDLTAQGFFFDAGTTRGYAATAGLEVRMR
ncbi:MAG: hypothetical protein KDC98_23280, partial [Planctomycetes bacterium]|nr:hypothetical protein [Planctomycetota bacterium]